MEPVPGNATRPRSYFFAASVSTYSISKLFSENKGLDSTEKNIEYSTWKKSGFSAH